MLIYLLDLSAVIFVSGILIHEKFLSIDFTRKESVGSVYSAAVRDMLLMPFLPAKLPSASADAAAHQLEALREQHDALLRSGEASQAFMQAWEQVRQDMRERPDALHAATLRTMVRKARELLTTVGNQSNLILDPDLDSYYAMSLVVLRFPELLEVMNDTMHALEGTGPRALQRGERRAELLILAGRIDAASLGIRSDYLQAFAAGSPALRAALEPGQRGMEQSLAAFLAIVQRLADGQASSDSIAQLQTAHAQTLRELDRAWERAALELDQMLAARVDALFTRMWLHLGTALLLLGCILTLVYAVAQQIARPLRHLARVADDVRRSGDYQRRAVWHSRDEIGLLVTAFNDMLAQLGRERESQQELASRERAARAQQEIVEAIPIPMVVTSIPRHEVLHANAPAAPWLDGQASDPWARSLEPGVRARFFQQLADRGAVDEFEVQWRGPAETSWAVLSARRLQFQGRDAILTAFAPINVQKQMERRLELWAKVFEASSESIVIMDERQHILSVNNAFCRSTSYDAYEAVGLDFSTLLDEQVHGPLAPRIADAVAERGAWQGEVAFRRMGSNSYPAWLMVSAVRESSRHGAISHYIGISVDITERKRTEARVRFLAEHDVLTELPNRALCVARLGEALAAAQQNGDRIAVLFIDLDRFKSINDTLGHHVGDALLRSVAGRLTQAVRDQDTVSRLGGDEFVVVLRGVRDADEVRSIVLQRLIPLIRAPHDGQGHELRISCSIGIAVYPEDGADLDELMRRADAAMYEAKAAGRDQFRFFSSTLDQLARERRTLEQHLRQAIAHGELHMHYQPRIDAHSLRVVGTEALMRWRHPELGDVPPGTFIPIAEETGLIRALGLWGLRQACAQLLRWQQACGPDAAALAMSVNLSTAQLGDPEVLEFLRGFIADSGIDPRLLELEITETQLMENAGAAGEGLAALHALGVRFSIDDFGTGYSSLTYLKRFPIDKLKIDRSFVQGLLANATDLAIVRTIIGLGHNLGLGVVAEGVETPEVAQQLKQMGCDELQGYYFARPMPGDALPAWLATRVLTQERASTFASER
ncbi:EAL domain-containing protein [Xylophilus sp. GW821-FHT01B05]